MIEILKNAFMGLLFALILVLSANSPPDDEFVTVFLIYILIGAFLSYVFIRD